MASTAGSWMVVSSVYEAKHVRHRQVNIILRLHTSPKDEVTESEYHAVCLVSLQSGSWLIYARNGQANSIHVAWKPNWICLFLFLFSWDISDYKCKMGCAWCFKL